MRIKLRIFLVTFLALLLWSCSDDSTTSVQFVYGSFFYSLNADGDSCDDSYSTDVVQGFSGFEVLNSTGFASYGCQVVNAALGHPVRSGVESIRFEVRNGDCGSGSAGDDCVNDISRHELIQSDQQVDGEESWYHFSVYVPDNTLVAGNVTVFLGQFVKSDGTPALMFEEFSSGYGARQNDADNNRVFRSILLNNDSYRDRWTDVMLHIKWSSATDGFIDIYYNGILNTSLTGPNMQSGGQTVRFQFGIYNAMVSRCNCSAMPQQIVYFDEIRKGPTRASVEL